MRLGALLTVAAAAAASGCDYGGAEGTEVVRGCGDLAAATVDTAAELEIVPGEGVGVFFEYLGDGAWRVATACDTVSSGNDCFWDVLINASAEGALGDFSSEGLETGDAIGYEPDGTLHFITETGTDVDAIMIGATPGSPVVFEAYLDGYCASPYMFWIGEGAVHGGSPGNPLELTPSE